MGEHPCVLSEIGIPYDMDDKYAYKTGDYTSQVQAMDANHFAIEGSGMNGFMLWLYMTTNNHQWGDLWNGEDLSIFSLDDQPLPVAPASSDRLLKVAEDRSVPSSTTRSSFDSSTVSPSNLKANLSTPSIGSVPPTSDTELSNNPGFRAAEAYVRPSPIATAGKVKTYGFDLRNSTFNLVVSAHAATTPDAPTEVFLPDFHFPRDELDVEVTGGKWEIRVDDTDHGPVQRLKWWHAEGEQTMKVKGTTRRAAGAMVGREEEWGYLDQCRQAQCSVM